VAIREEIDVSTLLAGTASAAEALVFATGVCGCLQTLLRLARRKLLNSGCICEAPIGCCRFSAAALFVGGGVRGGFPWLFLARWTLLVAPRACICPITCACASPCGSGRARAGPERGSTRFAVDAGLSRLFAAARASDDAVSRAADCGRVALDAGRAGRFARRRAARSAAACGFGWEGWGCGWYGAFSLFKADGAACRGGTVCIVRDCAGA
jgi:hypothetical protein